MRVYYRNRNIRRFNYPKVILLAIALVVLSVLFYGGYIFYTAGRPADANNDRLASLEITNGESLRNVAGRLEDMGLISSDRIFVHYARLKGLAGKIAAGNFTASPNMSMAEILLELTNTQSSEEVRVTFREGILASEIGERLQAAGVVSADEFLAAAADRNLFSSFVFLSDAPQQATLEGYLFPDTYEFKREEDAGRVIERMLQNFELKVDKVLQDEISRQGRSIYDVIILASIIEGEVGRPAGSLSSQDIKKLSEERRLVAGVFMNRLAINHPLQSDATLAYSTGERKSRLSLQDTQSDDPYNTYRYVGLPPSPINNPSLDAIVAAVYPADTDYFYFLSKENGEAAFARTLEEHNANKIRYLR